jgi:hypothetical protein
MWNDLRDVALRSGSVSAGENPSFNRGDGAGEEFCEVFLVPLAETEVAVDT